jgi:hypothetical protein
MAALSTCLPEVVEANMRRNPLTGMNECTLLHVDDLRFLQSFEALRRTATDLSGIFGSHNANWLVNWDVSRIWVVDLGSFA